MIKTIEIENYKCYEKHMVVFQPWSIIVGKNNAGKSTLVEALRLVSVITERVKGLNYKKIREHFVPSGIALTPSMEGLDLNLINIFNGYGNPPSIIKVEFDGGIFLSIYIVEDFKVFAFYEDSAGDIIKEKTKISKNIPKVGILPQVAPLLLHEKMLDREYIRKSMTTNLSYQHFRNQLLLFRNSSFQLFKEIVEESWPTVEIGSLNTNTGDKGNEISLIVRENDFASEVAWMGHGLQMWLQTMWFLARTRNYDTIILDEPDVYMHADLQKKLIRMIRDVYPQVIIATHSVEIIQEVSPDNIVILDRRNPISSSAKNFSAVQRLIEGLGTVNNLQLSRLWYSKKCLLVEGDDLSFLKILYDTLYKKPEPSLDSFPNMSIGGWNGWNYAVGSALFLKNSIGESIKVFCILDSDYHTKQEIEDREKEAIAKEIELHVWRKKEIENYFLMPEVIKRVIENSKQGIVLDDLEIPRLLQGIIMQEKENLVSKILDSISRENRRWEPSRALHEAKDKVQKYEDEKVLIDKISGKEILSKMSEACKLKYGVSFSVQKVVYEIRKQEINEEIIEFFNSFVQ